MNAQLIDVIKSCILILGALFPIVNPLGNSPIFLGLTRDYSTEQRNLLSRKIAVNGFVLLVVSILIGTHILRFFGISLPVVQVGGGLVVISTGWAMLNRKAETRKGADAPQEDIDREDLSARAFYPLTLPLTVGPGSISVAITLGANAPHYRGVVDLLPILPAVIGPALVAVTIYLSYRFAERLAELLGEVAMNVVLRLSSFILVCIGVQILWNGIEGLLRSTPALR
jgi:multiple antibiotic resistance protein